MSVMASRPVLRWAVPAGVIVAVLGGGALTTALRAGAVTPLPARTAAQLLVDLQTARLDGISGTVLERADLGLPALPAALGAGAGGDLTSLISGTHTLRVWYSGADKARVALTGATGESDIVHNGTDTWVWNSKANTATHITQTPGDKDRTRPAPAVSPTDLPTSPQDLANRVLAQLDPTTVVTTEPNGLVAGRPAYSLVLRPRDGASLVSQVRIAIDGTKHVPTQVEVFAKGYPDKAAFDIGFTQVSFDRPDSSVFTFNPPPGAKVTEGGKDATGKDATGKDATGKDATGKDATGKDTTGRDATGKDATGTPGSAAGQPKMAQIGTGWTMVVVAKTQLPSAAGTGSDNKSTGSNQLDLNGILGQLPQVHGAFGTGHVLSSRLFTALLLDDGRVLVGAVNQDRLIAAANDPAAALK